MGAVPLFPKWGRERDGRFGLNYVSEGAGTWMRGGPSSKGELSPQALYDCKS